MPSDHLTARSPRPLVYVACRRTHAEAGRRHSHQIQTVIRTLRWASHVAGGGRHVNGSAARGALPPALASPLFLIILPCRPLTLPHCPLLPLCFSCFEAREAARQAEAQGSPSLPQLQPVARRLTAPCRPAGRHPSFFARPPAMWCFFPAPHVCWGTSSKRAQKSPARPG